MKRRSAPSRNAGPLALPEALALLRDLACNLSWTWDLAAPSLFESIDPERWAEVEHNPVMLLRRLPRQRLRQLAGDRAFQAELRHIHCRMQTYLGARTWYQSNYARKLRGGVAYFSMEFGLHESLPIYAGGLGVLAGDHIKSASDLGLPVVGIGIFWRQGYMRQRIDAAGRQIDAYNRLLPQNLPLTEVLGDGGWPLRVKVPLGSDTVVARAWRLDVGRTRILLLDTNLPENAPRHRRLTDRLYSGDRDTRIRQEIVLGVGGWRLLRAMELPVVACHLNEGHAAFCVLERLAETGRRLGRSLAHPRCNFKQAARHVAATTVFTTHTPVPEGNEAFAADLVEKYVGSYARRIGISVDDLLALGRVEPGDKAGQFGMTPLALRFANHRNGVSELHGRVSRQMWRALWPQRSLDRVPIGSITNGIHLRTWLHPKMAALLDEYLPGGWDDRQDAAAIWAAVKRIPDARLWDLHMVLKRELLDFVRARLRRQLERQGAGTRAIRNAGAGLDPNALTVGFARRFTAYKRATLIFSDLKRILRIVADDTRPVQIIFAGKSHPADASGKALVTAVAKYAAYPRFKGRIVHLEDYDFDIARHMVAGVDVWLNNPQRPKEASGTSGMKPTLHGGLNLSILDGWWPEACQNGKNGWAIGKAADHDGSRRADRRDAQALYDCLEHNVIPLYYRRDRSGRPARWIRMMKRSLASIPPAFSSHRMVKDYLKRYYLPSLQAERT